MNVFLIAGIETDWVAVYATSRTLESLLLNNLSTVLILLGLLLMVFVAASVRKRAKENRALRKYEFEHTTDGGVVKFDTFEHSEEHERKRSRAAFSGCAAASLVIGATILFIGVSLIIVRLLSR